MSNPRQVVVYMPKYGQGQNPSVAVYAVRGADGNGAGGGLGTGFTFVASLPAGAVATGFLKTTVGGVDYYLGPWTVPAVPALAVGYPDGDYLVVAGGDVIVTQS